MNWNTYNDILADLIRKMNLEALNNYVYDQNGHLMYTDPNPPAPQGTIDLVFEEIKE